MEMNTKTVKNIVTVINNCDTIRLTIKNEGKLGKYIYLEKSVLTKDMLMELVDINETSLDRCLDNYIEELKERLNQTVREIKWWKKQLEQELNKE